MPERHPEGQVHVEIVEDRILHAVIDREEKKNGFTPKMLGETIDALTRLEDDPELRVGVVSFAGAHSTAGLDMPLFFGNDSSMGHPRVTDPVDIFGLGGRPVTKPVVTALQGITYTVGIELALAGDIVIAADDTTIAQLEPRRGLAAIGGGTFRYVQRAGWGNAMYHLLRADVFDVAEAFRIGLVQEVVETGTQVDRALAVGGEIATNAPLAVQATKANAALSLDAGETAAAASIDAMHERLTASDDFAEGVASFMERREAIFKGR